MKTLCVFLSLAFLTTAAFAQDPLNHPPRPSPRRGMTLDRVLTLYGEPRHRARIDGEEVWYYRLKFEQVYGRALVPNEFSSENVYLGAIYFNAGGKVSHFDWTHSR